MPNASILWVLSLSRHVLLRGLDLEAYGYRPWSSLGPFLIGAFFNNILYGVSHLTLPTHVERSQDVDLFYHDKVCILQVRALQDWEHLKCAISNRCPGFCILQKIQTVRLASFFRFTTFSWQSHRDKPWMRYFVSYPWSPFLTWRLILVRFFTSWSSRPWTRHLISGWCTNLWCIISVSDSEYALSSRNPMQPMQEKQSLWTCHRRVSFRRWQWLRAGQLTESTNLIHQWWRPVSSMIFLTAIRCSALCLFSSFLDGKRYTIF